MLEEDRIAGIAEVWKARIAIGVGQILVSLRLLGSRFVNAR